MTTNDRIAFVKAAAVSPLSAMRRYDCAQSTETSTGEWVRYSDVEAHNAECLRVLNDLLENVRLSGLEAEAKLDAANAKAGGQS